MTTRTLLQLVAMLVVAGGCRVRPAVPPPQPAARAPDQAPRDPPAPRSAEPTGTTVGVATMTEDGVIVLRLRAGDSSGRRGEAVMTYRPDHPDYERIRAHVGPIGPGQTVPVKPWPDEP